MTTQTEHDTEKTVWTFEELSDKAKETARDWWREGACQDDWWQNTYEDAEQCGLKITGFELDRSKHADGEFTGSAADCAKSILKEHGDQCDTYNTALTFLAQYVLEEMTATDDDRDRYTGMSDVETELCDQFLKDILESYADMLQSEYEYLQSDEAADEALTGSDYEFDEDGEVQ